MNDAPAFHDPRFGWESFATFAGGFERCLFWLMCVVCHTASWLRIAVSTCEVVGAERLARSRLPDSESGGSAVPREPRAEKLPFLAGLAPASDSP